MSPPRLLVGLALLPIACGGERERVVQPLPAPDTRPALQRPGPPPQAIASYRIDAALDAGQHRIAGSQTLTWRNTGQNAVDQLPFHLYLNAFKNDTSVFMRESLGRHRGARASKGNWGWIEVKTIRVGDGPDLAGKAVFPGPDETVLEVPLDRPVPPGGSIDVAMTFDAQLPEVFARTGFKGDFIMVGQWFPKIGVRVAQPSGGEAWHCEPFHLMSEFFADFGTYDVSLTVPDTHVVAATGMLVKARDNPDATRTLQYHAEAVHDFVWMADPFMQTISGAARTKNGEVEVRVYFRPEQRDFAERHLAAGIGAIETFSRLLVPYPWPRMSIVDPPADAAGGAGGMEYPTLVTTGLDLPFAIPGVRFPEFVTIHEVGHNWLQGILATNEVDEAWLDEGMNEYVDGLVMAALYGREANAVDRAGLRAEYFAFQAVLDWPYRDLPDPIGQRSFEFADARSYADATYGKTASLMRTLENVVGSERFLAALRAYAETHAFTHPREADLVAALERSLGQKLDWFLTPALHQPGAPDLEVRSIRCRVKREPQGVFGRGAGRKVVDTEPAEGAPSICQVTVENLGRVPVPVDIEISFADGERVRRRWDDRGEGPRWKRFEVEHRKPVVEVVIDPDRLVPFDDAGPRRGLRVAPEIGPARRAATHGQFLTQTAMELFGP
ncbi:MAG TPA: M1 family metallopeptidase [Candidatus Acidoferrum sp.]|nr:M1 family metallopeptidase [Candidatus Acidoferrum sp.]